MPAGEAMDRERHEAMERERRRQPAASDRRDPLGDDDRGAGSETELHTDDLTRAAGERRSERERTVQDPAGADVEVRGASGESDRPLLGGVEDLRSRWDTIQAGFVDEPRRSVEQADSLVADAIQRLAESFAQTRQDLEEQWTRGADVSTEDLRVALQRYRSFFDRLLQI
jgi:molecular chaperone GrpE (heat shock protein)